MTIGYESWAVDLAEVGAVYPFQGGEVLMAIVGIAFWVGWHIWQIKYEDSDIQDEVAKVHEVVRSE